MNNHSYDDIAREVGSGECATPAVDEGAVGRAREALRREAVPEQAALFAALGDPTRLTILSALAAERLCVCDLAALTGVTQSCVSHQLRLLRELDLVAFDRDGKRAVYRLADDHVASLLALARDHAAEKLEDRCPR